MMDGRWSVGRWSLVDGQWSMVMVMVMVRNVWSHSLSTLCVKILKWQSVTDSLTKVRYRAARAAKNRISFDKKATSFAQSS